MNPHLAIKRDCTFEPTKHILWFCFLGIASFPNSVSFSLKTVCKYHSLGCKDPEMAFEIFLRLALCHTFWRDLKLSKQIRTSHSQDINNKMARKGKSAVIHELPMAQRGISQLQPMLLCWVSRLQGPHAGCRMGSAKWANQLCLLLPRQEVMWAAKGLQS